MPRTVALCSQQVCAYRQMQGLLQKVMHEVIMAHDTAGKRMQGLLRSVAHEVRTAHNRAVSVARLKGQQLFAAPCCSSVVCRSSSECGSVDGAQFILLYHTWCSYHRCELLVPGPCTQQYTPLLDVIHRRDPRPGKSAVMRRQRAKVPTTEKCHIHWFSRMESHGPNRAPV